MPTSRELIQQAMSLKTPSRVPVMSQMAIGHTVLHSGVHPVDFFLTNDTYAGALLAMRERYRFDGVLLHKPGRDASIVNLVERVDRDAPIPTLHLIDGAKIECRRDDDPYYLPGPTFHRPVEVTEIDPADPLAWAPESYRRWCEHKGTANIRTPDGFPGYWYGAIDNVLAKAGMTHSVHGEVRSPLDHFAAVFGLQEAMMALVTDPDHVRRLMDAFTDMSTAWAVAQVRRGCNAIKLSSPYAGAGFLSRDMYREWVLPYERRINQAVRNAGAFAYTHTCGAIGDRLDLMAESGAHGVEALDPPPLGTVELSKAKQVLRDRLFIKGNVNPVMLLQSDLETARREIAKTLATGAQGGQFILSTACSIAPRTPPEHIELMIRCAEEAATH
jgi:uroporphyrinogen-III decarboxylase